MKPRNFNQESPESGKRSFYDFNDNDDSFRQSVSKRTKLNEINLNETQEEPKVLTKKSSRKKDSEKSKSKKKNEEINANSVSPLKRSSALQSTSKSNLKTTPEKTLVQPTDHIPSPISPPKPLEQVPDYPDFQGFLVFFFFFFFFFFFSFFSFHFIFLFEQILMDMKKKLLKRVFLMFHNLVYKENLLQH